MKGIYKITNNINGKFYIGLSRRINKRFSEHKAPFNVLGKSTVLAKAFRKYGIQNFTFEILETCDNDQLLCEKEIAYIKKLKPAYNMNEGGKGNPGREVSAKTKRILSKKGKAQWLKMSDQDRKVRIEKNLTGPSEGHSVSKHTRDKIRKKLTGRTLTKKHCRNISAKQKKSMKGNQNGNKAVCKLLDGIEVGKYESIVSAAKELKINSSGITNVLHGKQKTASGYTWEYVK